MVLFTTIFFSFEMCVFRLIALSALQRENRSLLCDVFESASRGAAAAFIASNGNEANASASQAVVPKQQQQQQQQQTSNTLVLCALACIYELACRHWKMV
jgi:hypothetical protein